jgi:hypothetical protein
MSDELRLPDDLAACEARLAAEALPATGIDRDQLLYRAGWSACEARFVALNSTPSKGGPRGGIVAAWSATSAAIAASVAVVLTLQWPSIADRDLASKPREAQSAVSTEIINPAAAKSAPAAFPYASTAIPNRPRFPAGLLALRRQTLTNAWLEPTSIASTNGDPSPTPAKTARELMNEYLPKNSGRLNGLWLWGAAPEGDSI